MKKTLVILLLMLISKNVSAMKNFNDSLIINKHTVSIKQPLWKDFNEKGSLKKDVTAFNEYFKTKEKRIYTDVFEEISFKEIKFYSFYIVSKNAEEDIEEKLVLKYSKDKIEKYLLRYKRINGFKIDSNTFEFYFIKDKSEVEIVPVQKECLKSDIVILNKEELPKEKIPNEIGVFDLQSNCSSNYKKIKKDFSLPILTKLQIVPFYLVY